MDNRLIASVLRKHARHLQETKNHLYCVRAYRRAADTIERLEFPLEQVYQTKRRPGLERLPGIGRHLSFTLESLLTRGEFRTWADRLDCSGSTRSSQKTDRL